MYFEMLVAILLSVLPLTGFVLGFVFGYKIASSGARVNLVAPLPRENKGSGVRVNLAAPLPRETKGVSKGGFSFTDEISKMKSMDRGEI